MAFGLGVLALPPAHFWSMTPREIAAAMRGLTGSASAATPLTRPELDRLMARFPDRGSTTDGSASR